MRNLPSLLFLALLIIVSGAAMAKTPDSRTPSEESVCSDHSGALFGLCNTYCEAMDCGNPGKHGSPHACTVIAENYKKKSGGDELSCGDKGCDIGVLEACADPSDGVGCQCEPCVKKVVDENADCGDFWWSDCAWTALEVCFDN